MNYILFDDPEIRLALLPLTFTRPISKIRIGIFTIAEKWEHFLKQPLSYSTADYLQEKYPLNSSVSEDSIYINGAVCPTAELVNSIKNLFPGESIYKNQQLLAYRDSPSAKPLQFVGDVRIILQLWDIFLQNSLEISSDLNYIKTLRKSYLVNDVHTRVYCAENIFIEEGVTIRAAIINAEAGPVYLGKDSVVNEGAIIKGPFSLGEGSHITMGAKMRGDSTIGPFCKVGGEVSNSILFGYSNKGHDGFIGNTIIGEWCNLGADTNTSNLKNNYSEVEFYNYKTAKFEKTGRQFLGLVMGDHSKCGINTMFNTGTSVGVSANIFGGGFPPKFVPSFSWGGAHGFDNFDLNKSIKVAEAMMSRRNVPFDDVEKKIFERIYQDYQKK